jgi:hypothetical protein
MFPSFSSSRAAATHSEMSPGHCRVPPTYAARAASLLPARSSACPAIMCSFQK